MRKLPLLFLTLSTVLYCFLDHACCDHSSSIFPLSPPIYLHPALTSFPKRQFSNLDPLEGISSMYKSALKPWRIENSQEQCKAEGTFRTIQRVTSWLRLSLWKLNFLVPCCIIHWCTYPYRTKILLWIMWVVWKLMWGRLSRVAVRIWT